MAREASQTDARLRERGFDPSAPAAQAVATLTAMRGTAGVDDAMIAHALGEIASAEAAAALLAIAPGASGTLRREIRRALFKLRQRGVAIPAAVAAEQSPPAPSGEQDDLNALISATDAAGARIAWLLKARGGGGLRRLWGLVSESEGLVGATLESVTRKGYRAERVEVARRAGTPLIDADWRLVDFILCEAYRRTPEARRGRVGNFLTIRAEIIASAPPHDLRHPIYDELAAELGREPSVELMRDPDVAAFQLPIAATKPYADEIAGLRQSVIVLSRMQQEDRVNQTVERAIGELITGETAYRLRRHLEDTAYFFLHTGKRTLAEDVAAAAAGIRDGADLKRAPFFRAFMRAQLGAILAGQQEEAREEPRLIMTPAEAIRARQAAQARMRGRGR
jgi:hypothetical protein